MARLKEDNQRLRRSLVTQINQRAYFEEEYRRTAHKLRTAEERLEQAELRLREAARREQQLKQILEAHEATNQALQKQLSQTLRDCR